MTTVEEFVSRTLGLLEKERDAEIEETRILTEQLLAKELERRGICLLKLQLSERRTGLYGRIVATFQPFWTTSQLPAHNLTPGDIVGLSLTNDRSKTLASGIISRVTSSIVQVAFEEAEDVFCWSDEDKYSLTKLANDVTYKRLKRTLSQLAKYSSGPALRLINILFGLSPLSPPLTIPDLKWINSALDKSQQEAVWFALSQPEIAIIHGPPGTGKTTTVVEVILQAVQQGLKILALAPSNIAVDNLVERLAQKHKYIVRIGHPARLLPQTQQFSLDALVAASDQSALAADVRKDLEKALASSGPARRQIKELRKELREREEAAVRNILTRADVVLATLTSAGQDSPVHMLKEDHFGLVVIDECSQALEAASWMGLLHAGRCVLAGDPQQLPPTILSREAADAGLSVTLMERAMTSLGKSALCMLTTQYRMHNDICQWASCQMYNNRLQAHPSVAHHLLRDLAGVEDTEETSIPLLLIDTAGCNLHELDLALEVSKGNEGEADIVAAHVHQLVKAGLAPSDIAVIAPYNLQVELLRQRLSEKYAGLEIKSVDGFQGREKEAVIISFVRSNTKGEVGFLAENRRVNVAITRARRHLAVVCDSETVSQDGFLHSLLDYIQAKGQVWSAQQYIQDGLVKVCTSPRPAQLENLMSQDSKKEHQQRKDRKKRQQVKSDHTQLKSDLIHIPSGHSGKGHQKLQQSTEDKTQIYQHLLQEFLTSSETIINFPSSLSSHDRMVIHEVSQSLGLLHTSQGEGKDRFIVVAKPGLTIEQPSTDSTSTHSFTNQLHPEISSITTPPQLAKDSSSNTCVADLDTKHLAQDSSSNTCVADFDTKHLAQDSSSKTCVASITVLKQLATQTTTAVKKRTKCSYCGHDILAMNFELHEAHCSQNSSKHKPQAGNVKTGKQKSTPQSQVLQVAKSLDKVADDDFEGMISVVMELDSKCSFKKCKTLSRTLGGNCIYCSRRFCLQHFTPEVHGCGEACRIHARQTTVKEGVLYRGSGVPSKKPPPDKRAQLERKLDRKLGELSGQRKRKEGKSGSGH